MHSVYKNFSARFAQILAGSDRYLGKQASPPSHKSEPRFYQKK